MRYNRSGSYFFVNDTEIIKFNAKGSEIVAAWLCLGNISVIDFSADYDAIAVYDIPDIHKYWMEKNWVV